MLFCNYCNEKFETPKILREYHNELDESPYEEMAVCPYCGDEDIEVLHKCRICGEYEHNLIAGACPVCRLDLVSRFRNMLLQFTGIEKDVLNELYDGECF